MPGKQHSALSSLRDFFVGREWRGHVYFISPLIDLMMVGGLAVITLLLLLILFPASSENLVTQKIEVAALMGWLAFAVNDPHFIVSYQLLYRNYGEKLRCFQNHNELRIRYLIAGIIAPAAMFLYFTYAFVTHDADLFAYAINTMIVLVGWHYVKQAFGVFIMLSSLKKVYYTLWQRRFFLFNSYLVWACYCVEMVTDNSLGHMAVKTLWDIPYSALHLFTIPKSMHSAIGMVLVFFAILSPIVAIWEKKRISMTGLLGYASMYYLLFAAAFHPMWILIYPFFHSLQYLLFVFAYKRGETRSTIAEAKNDVEIRRIKTQLLRFVFFTVSVGILCFSTIPWALEMGFNPSKSVVFPVTAAFIIFINIHHYFIDNVIWRKEHYEIAKYLFNAS